MCVCVSEEEEESEWKGRSYKWRGKSATSTEQEQPQFVELGDGRQVTQSLVGKNTRSAGDSVIRQPRWHSARHQWSRRGPVLDWRAQRWSGSVSTDPETPLFVVHQSWNLLETSIGSGGGAKTPSCRYPAAKALLLAVLETGLKRSDQKKHVSIGLCVFLGLGLDGCMFIKVIKVISK